MNINDVVSNLKSRTCIYCNSIKEPRDKNESKAIRIVLPCYCFLCKSTCIKEFFKTTVFYENNPKESKNFILKPKEFVCICSKQYNLSDLKNLYKISSQLQNKDVTKFITKVFKNTFISSFTNVCFSCFVIDNNKKNPITLRKIEMLDEDTCKILDKKVFQHLICLPCVKMYRLKE